jgi:large subunit ribosomal protein L32e
MKALLELRNALKQKKPTFLRHDAHKKQRANNGSWRRPKGRQNKMRLHRKGYARGRSTGFGSPNAVKGLSREGLTQNLVHNAKELESLDPKTDGVIFSGTLGSRKKLALIKAAQEKKFTIIGLNAKRFEETVTKKLDSKKQKRKALTKKAESKKASAKASEKASQKASEKTSKKEASKDEKDAKVEEKKEHDKILTKKDGDFS